MKAEAIENKLSEFFQKFDATSGWYGFAALIMLKLVLMVISVSFGWSYATEIVSKILYSAGFVCMTMVSIALMRLVTKMKGFAQFLVIGFIVFLFALEFLAALSYRFQIQAKQEAASSNIILIEIKTEIDAAREAKDTAYNAYNSAHSDDSKYKKRRLSEYEALRDDYRAVRAEYKEEEAKAVNPNQVVNDRLALIVGGSDMSKKDVKALSTKIDTWLSMAYTFGMTSCLFVLTSVLAFTAKNSILRSGSHVPNGTPPPKGSRTRKEEKPAPEKWKPVPVKNTDSAPKPAPVQAALLRAEPRKPRALQTKRNEKFQGFCAELQSNKFSDLKTRTIVSHSKFVNSMDTARKYLDRALDSVPNIEAHKDEQGKTHYRYKTGSMKLRAV